MKTPLVSTEQEKAVLEQCLSNCKRSLDHFRAVGNEIQAALAQADMDKILDELAQIYKRIRLTKAAHD